MGISSLADLIDMYVLGSISSQNYTYIGSICVYETTRRASDVLLDRLNWQQTNAYPLHTVAIAMNFIGLANRDNMAIMPQKTPK